MTPVYHLPKWKFLLYLFTVPGMFSRYRSHHKIHYRNTFYRACSWLDFMRCYEPKRKWKIKFKDDPRNLILYVGYIETNTGIFNCVIPIRYYENPVHLWQDRFSLTVFKYQNETIYKI